MKLELDKDFITNGRFRAGSGVEKVGGTLVKVLGFLPKLRQEGISWSIDRFYYLRHLWGRYLA
jgi:hypothetical protein